MLLLLGVVVGEGGRGSEGGSVCFVFVFENVLLHGISFLDNLCSGGGSSRFATSAPIIRKERG